MTDGMATTAKLSTPAAAATAVPTDETSWFTPQRLRVMGIAAGAVALVALITWFIIAAGQRKQTYAAAALEDARQVAQQSNFGLAVQRYSAIIANYGGTSSAYEANLGIAQVRLVADQDQLAVTTLTDFLKTNPPALYAAPANGLLGTAYENLGRFPDAEAAYRKEADLAIADYLKATSLLDAGRAARLAKKNDEAIAIYQEILTKYGTTAAHTEAEIRLSELTQGKQ
ncbi:MAG TPA: tetratricopeptide repeat protein [Gemmatimonadales bacterium]|jgi:tetratricopeptide (TPR) repeat protein|nr:tetratricopeptide repeat protein [Gemmatimonadales bacterium]